MCWLVALEGAQRPLPSRGYAPRAIRCSLSRRRDQLFVLQAAPPGDLRSLGRIRPCGLLILCQGAESHQPRTPPGGCKRLARQLPRCGDSARRQAWSVARPAPSEPVVLPRYRGEVFCRAQGPIRRRTWPLSPGTRAGSIPWLNVSCSSIGSSRVAADPAVVPAAALPGGWDDLLYYRLHGSPKIYYSAYSDENLDALTADLIRAARSAVVWCIFDNTAVGAATVNAFDVLGRLTME